MGRAFCPIARRGARHGLTVALEDTSGAHYLYQRRASALLVNMRQHSSGLKQIRGGWRCRGSGFVTWLPPVHTGPRELDLYGRCGVRHHPICDADPYDPTRGPEWVRPDRRASYVRRAFHHRHRHLQPWSSQRWRTERPQKRSR